MPTCRPRRTALATRPPMGRHLPLCALLLLFASAARSEAPRPLTVPPDSPRWDLQEQARVADYQGRKCLLIDGGAATLKDFELRDGVVVMDVATAGGRGFFGIQFRGADDGATPQRAYLRPPKAGLPHALACT